MDERREYHRFLLHTKIKHQSIKGNIKGESSTRDISVGGICITTTEEPLPLDDTFEITFSLPRAEEEINAQGKVVWTKSNEGLYDNGLLFTYISDENLALIQSFSIGSVEAK